ncbi:hypothetical protein [Gracilibacillus kekensis]|uniref:Uncharacterized protein n=1 Tax=Gracilibacillus kekensis TaxID=1027249 RepID=A0A1M7Q7V7_9BACI|nr:hypothetical protein [Gracilibacillus kekensis]SHN26601.1 hypothetical protein SAMN05216179_2879 [Gracilibacillus kekensis]
MNILFGIFVWLVLCCSILILASLATRMEENSNEETTEGYIGYIEEIYNRNILDQEK